MSHKFLDRFDAVWSRKRHVQLGQILVSTLLAALLGFGALVILDYALELGPVVRTVLLLITAAGVAAFAGFAVWRTGRRWSRPSTAAEIEAAFPQLGQSVRTTVQYSSVHTEQLQAEGIAQSLVVALEERTHTSALPLELATVVPQGRLKLVAAAALLVAVGLAGAAGLDWQWSTAAKRAALVERPYRTLLVEPGNLLVDEQSSATIQAALVGRADREVSLLTRLAGESDAEWTERTLEPVEMTGDDSTPSASAEGPTSVFPAGVIPAAVASQPRAEFAATLPRLTEPLEYRIRAGDLESPAYRIDIRRPLRLVESRVELAPPSYTGQPAAESLDLNLNALEGTLAQFQLTFDKPVKSASLVLAPRRGRGEDEESTGPIVIPLVRQGATESSAEASAVNPRRSTESWAAELALTEDHNYHIEATAADETTLPENKYRIRVRQDQPPQITFESPDDSVEVHALTELAMRVRVRDDYGLKTAGVVFQVNNEQEIPLLAQDFDVVAAAATEARESGAVSPTTLAQLEKLLPLELFELTQKDSVMYYAFAEDNRPNQPQRTETDIRFIDIRPFKRSYLVVDPDPMPNMGNGPGLRSLEEMIQRQRFALNQTIQIEKRAAHGRLPDAASLDQLMQFETDLAANARGLAEGLQARGFDDVQLLFEAEAAMLAAVDSLSVGSWENATLQMKDALKALIEQRDRTQTAILKNPDPAQLAALRRFDRLQAQKLRRPKTDKEEARELVRRLEALIAEENGVADALLPESPPAETAAPETPAPSPMETPPAEAPPSSSSP